MIRRVNAVFPGMFLSTPLLLAACGAEDPNGEMQLGAEQAPSGPSAGAPSAPPSDTTTQTPPTSENGAGAPGASASAVGSTMPPTGSTPPVSSPGPGEPLPSPDPVDPTDPSTPGTGPDSAVPAIPSSDPMSPDPMSPDPMSPNPMDPAAMEPTPAEPVVGAGSQCADGQLAPGFYVDDGRIYDNHCSEFVMRGVNYPYVWFKDSQDTAQMFRDIAATGANTVRVVLATGDQWTRVSGSEITSIIGWAKENELVAMLEVHDATGYGEKAEATHPQNAVAYWLSDDVRSAVAGQEAYVMINIANEPFGNNDTDQWEPFHVGAVAELRAGGLQHLFIVDAPNWGQDWTNTMRDGMGPTNIFAADPAGNTAFSVHMYDVYGTSEPVWSYFESFLGSGMALLVGEFAADHGPGNEVDEDAIMAGAEEHRLGYLGWSWSGNSSDLTSLDLVQSFNASAFTAWGQRLIDGENGLRETSRPCRCFE